MHACNIFSCKNWCRLVWHILMLYVSSLCRSARYIFSSRSRFNCSRAWLWHNQRLGWPVWTNLINYLWWNIKLITTARYTSIEALLWISGMTRRTINISTPLAVSENWVLITYLFALPQAFLPCLSIRITALFAKYSPWNLCESCVFVRALTSACWWPLLWNHRSSTSMVDALFVSGRNSKSCPNRGR